MALKVIVRAEMFVHCVTFSSGARRDPRACREILKRCYPASAALDPTLLDWPPVVVGEAFLGKQMFEVLPLLWREMPLS
jgi:hypothetical protein